MKSLDIECLEPEHDLNISFSQSEKLNAQIRIQYTILQRELKYVPNTFDTTKKTCWNARESIKNYLHILNNKAQLPLSFRLQVMAFLQKTYASYFDSEYITLALKSYQVAIDVLTATRTQNNLAILKITNSAIKLSIYDLKIRRQKYEPIEKKKNTLLYNMVHRLYPFIAYLDTYHAEQLERFGKKLCQYVVLQHLDFFSKTIEEQNAMVHILDQALTETETFFYTKGELLHCPTDKTCSYLALYPDYPGIASKVFSTFAKQYSEHDMVLFDLTSFLIKICQQAKHTDKRKTYCLIRDDLLRYHRTSPRKKTLTNTPVFLDLHAASAFHNKRLFKLGCQHSNLNRGRSSWHVLDYSKTGVSLARSSQHPFGGFKQGLLVGIQWSTNNQDLDDKYHLGFLRWYKSQQGQEQVGIEFLKTAYSVLYAVIRNTKSIVLCELPDKNILWLPSQTCEKNEKIDLYRKHDALAMTIIEILETGQNYNRCLMKTTLSHAKT